MYSDKENINILTSLLVAHGVRHVVVCPGSRNAPLVHNFAECPLLDCHPVTDERSAAFMALGLRQQTSTPVAVCVTSGSALLNTLPGTAEATYQHQGIIVISGDRPSQWIDQLDGQTLPQDGALGRFVGKSVTLPEPHNAEERWQCNRLINEAIIENLKPSHPSVHINVPISEPLFSFTTKTLPEERVIRRMEWGTDACLTIIEQLKHAERPMMVIGQMSRDIVSLAEKISEAMVTLTEPMSAGVSLPCYCDQMLHIVGNTNADYQPDLILYAGGHTVSKRLRQFLRALPDTTTVIMLTDEDTVKDVTMHARMVVVGNLHIILSEIAEHLTASSSPFQERWTQLHDNVCEITESYSPEYSSMLAVKRFEESISNLPSDHKPVIHYANSMPLRLATVYARHFIRCNRGLNGIEGSLSTAAGTALCGVPTYCVTGDLSFFYDENALWQQQLKGNFRILLLNNHQGAIFRNLKGLEQSSVRDDMVAGEHHLTAEGICQQFGITYLQATDTSTLNEQMQRFITIKNERPVLLEILTDAEADERAFKTYYKQLSTTQLCTK